ncbi:RsmF rRNA methyltransferase first C-terminal domain-containing protein [Terrisporobacter glycolicus]|uniref:Ribosomal RNA small subunit methyltransferase F n=1 Tax=Terrisporobacter glycolicus ATCC 14880 = DSM 1288 TaxID=1121315 RepID=A0ABZ2EZG5_9FIRM|nr:RsmF rRNA methyltransferase first C-terminal domain-containing protein [Terrisporobacter glycolicus]
MTNLPKQFLDEMKEILGSEFDDFLKSYDEPKTTGLRLNTMKMDKDKLLDLDLFQLTSIPWAEEGFYYDEKINRPGKNPLHESGAYYLQEPSAMSVVPKLEVKEGDKVLDLCAAPGGKSTYILSKLNNTGILVSNEINPTRIKALGENLERFGAKNCIITNTDSTNLKKVFTGYFDKVVIDAPCSGQGMFRKDQVAIDDWSYSKVLECQSIQRDIIKDGFEMLNKDGVLVYSTCTFAKEENEYVINEFINENKGANLVFMERLWPHKVKGEGHFVAKIKKVSEETCFTKRIKVKPLGKELSDYKNFEKKFLNIEIKGEFYIKGENLYLLPENCPDTKKLKVLRNGLHLGLLKKNRFEPSHAFSHYLTVDDVQNIEDLSINDDRTKEYLRGNTIKTDKSRGWVLVTIEGIPLGWGKETNGILKNHYPKGLRINYT